MKIKIYLHKDEKCREVYEINILDYQSANGDELEVLKEINMDLANWLNDLERRTKKIYYLDKERKN